MSFASKVLYTGDGNQTQFTVTFPLISATHLFVFVNEVLQLNPLNYTYTGSTVTFGSAPDADDAIEIKRSTSPTALLVDFVDGSVLNEADLDLAYQHNFYLLQETVDSFNELINNTLIDVATQVGIVSTVTDEIIVALVNEMLNSASAATIQQRVSDIDANAEAILTLTDDFQVQINTIAQGVAAIVYIQDGEPIPGVGGIPDPIADGARWYDSDDNNKPYIYNQSGTVWVSLEDPRIGSAAADILVLQANVGSNFAAIIEENFVQANHTFALASSLKVLGAATADKTAFVIDLDSVLIDTDAGISLATRFTQLSSVDGDNAAAITTESTARTDGDSAIATTFALLGAENGGGSAFILNEDTVKISSDGGDTLAVRFTGLSASTATVQTNLDTEAGDRATGDSNEATARAADVSQLNADISAVQTAYVSADSVVAGTVTTLAARVTTAEGEIDTAQIDITATVTATTAAQNDADTAQAAADTNAAVVVTLNAHYGVSLNVNGYITGFIQNNDGSSGEFVILADKFAVVDPSGDPAETEYVPFSIANGKINMTGDVIIDGNLIVTGTINGSSLINGTIGTTQIGANAITTTQLNADSITANKIQANAITAAKINVTLLSAISADLGAITAGTIVMNTSGFIRGGQSAYNTGAGFFLGYDGAAYKFSIGDGGNNSITWDGVDMVVSGTLLVGTYVADAAAVILTANIERSSNLPAEDQVWQVMKRFKIGKAGTVRIYWTDKRELWNAPDNRVFPQIRILIGTTAVHTEDIQQDSWLQDNYILTMSEADVTKEIIIEIMGGGNEDPDDDQIERDGLIKDVTLRAITDVGDSVLQD